MSRRHVEELSRVWEHLLKDAAQAYPDLVGEFERDLARFHNLVRARGIHLLMVDFPSIAKHLERCLEKTKYQPSGLPASKQVSRGVVIPKFLRGLYLLVFHEDGSLKEKPDSQAVFFLRQLLLFAKKAEYDCPVKNKVEEIREFLTVDVALPAPNGIWESDDPGAWSGELESFQSHFSMAHGGNATLYRNLDLVSGFLASALGRYDYRDWRFRHGPGAIAESTGPSNKYLWRNWSGRLDSVFPMADCGYHSYASWASDMVVRKVGSKDPPSRLICVPKTYSKPRLIAAEPSEHQWCQQNVWHYFCDRARDSWIFDFVRFRDQSLNQSLCLEGSKEGTLATLDLSSASDRVTCWAVEALFRSNPPLVRALAASRTRFVELPQPYGFGGLYRKLNKFSTMGSACTFPVESLLFLAISLAAVITDRKQRVTLETVRSLAGEVAVFGDDIIVPVDHRAAVQDALEVCHFQVNTAKSFSTGRFRESCGVDSFNGQEVTPIYWKGVQDGKPESVARTIALHNNLQNRFLMRTAGYVASTLRGLSIPYVEAGSGAVGLKTRTGLRNRLKKRYNEGLQRFEVLVHTISGTVQKTATNDDSAVFQYFTESPSPLDKWCSGVPQRPRLTLRRGWVAEAELLARE